jgi:hypothetical protein
MSLPPIVWKPSPNFGCMVRGTRGRAGQPIRGWVYHRMVGYLSGTDAAFASPDRAASSTFGIGRINGRLEIHQYVDLADTAWANGGVNSPSWSVVKALPGVNPNQYSVSVEHEDGGRAGRGIVREDIWAASMELTRICTSGRLTAIRGVGVHISDREDRSAAALVSELANLPISPDGFTDHHAISGPLKPHCFRAWIDDDGFVAGSPSRRDRLFEVLRMGRVLPDTATDAEDDMLEWVRNAQEASFLATLPKGTNIRFAPRLRDDTLAATLSGDLEIAAVARVWGDEFPEGSGDHWWHAFIHPNKGLLVVHRSQLTNRHTFAEDVQAKLDAAEKRAGDIKDEALKGLTGGAIFLQNKANQISRM